MLSIPNALIKLNNTALPNPSENGLRLGSKKVWSKNTGRTSNSALMVGDIVAIKKTIDITWEILTEDQVNTIETIVSNPANAFMTLEIYDPAQNTTITKTVYAGDIDYPLSYIDANHGYYTNVTLNLVEQ